MPQYPKGEKDVATAHYFELWLEPNPDHFNSLIRMQIIGIGLQDCV